MSYVSAGGAPAAAVGLWAPPPPTPEPPALLPPPRAPAAAHRPDGFNVGVNQGSVAGAGVAGHLHVHVVPRWHGDTSFMPVLGEVRVLPESLDATHDRLVVAPARGA